MGMVGEAAQVVCDLDHFFALFYELYSSTLVALSEISELICVNICDPRGYRDPPPLKWSDLRYVFDIKED
jgi:hypothetical protein